MSLTLNVPNQDSSASKVSELLELDRGQTHLTDEEAASHARKVMDVDLGSTESKQEVRKDIDNLASDITRHSVDKNRNFCRRLSELSMPGSESGEVSKNLDALSSQVEELDPSGADFSKNGPFGKPQASAVDYLGRCKNANVDILSTVSALEAGKNWLAANDEELEREESSMLDMARELAQQIELVRKTDQYVTKSIEDIKATGKANPAMVEFIEKETLAPLRQKLSILEHLDDVTRKGLVAMDIVRGNNAELSKATRIAEDAATSFLNVTAAVTAALYNQADFIGKVSPLDGSVNDKLVALTDIHKKQGRKSKKNQLDTGITTQAMEQAFEGVAEVFDHISAYKQSAFQQVDSSIAEFEGLVEHLDGPVS